MTDSSYPDWEEAGTQSDSTKVSRISYRDGKMKLEASGSVEGVLTDDMAMSEYQGNLRIATTKTAYGIEKVTDDIDGEIIGYDTQESTTYNQLYILGKNLKIKGKIENLAKGEEIYAVRFLGNTGYVVTFRQTDPLFSIDLSDPKKPKVLGKLKISGFSEYLHGYGEGLLLGLVCGGCLFCILSLANLAFDGSGFGIIALSKLAAVLFASALGGVVGVNKRKKFK